MRTFLAVLLMLTGRATTMCRGLAIQASQAPVSSFAPTAVALVDGQDQARAQALASRWSLPLVDLADRDALAPFHFVLEYLDEDFRHSCLALRSVRDPTDPTGRGKKGPRASKAKPLVIDFADIVSSRGRGQELVVKACRGRQKELGQVWDLTAGLGRDAAILAAAGAQVHMFERCVVLGALLDDALARAEGTVLGDRLQLTVADSLTTDLGHLEAPAVVYCDPMFPPRTKSALVKRDMQVMHRLLDAADLGADGPRSPELETAADATMTMTMTMPRAEQEAILIARACSFAQKRTVVKRPRHAPCLGDIPPQHSVEGSTNRFDVYLAQETKKG